MIDVRPTRRRASRRARLSRVEWPAAFLSAVLTACAGSATGTAGATPAPTAAVPPAAAPRAAAKPPRPRAPLTHVEMKVLDVVPTRQGAAVLLVDEASDMALPIFIGGTEALSIALRHEDRHYERPLTHDLLDAIMERLGGALVKVHVDDLRDGVFIGTVFVQQGQRVVSIDARPSDAIALAIGNHVPIFVSRQVLEAAGIRRKDLEKGGQGPDLPAPPPGNVEKL